MTDDWRQLRVGDRVRIIRMPTDFSRPGYYVHENTVALYQHLIDEGCIVVVTEIDDQGLPRIEFEWETAEGTEYHGLAINDDSWERV